VNQAIEILLEQGPVLVVNKPGGLATQAPPGIDSLEARIKAFLIEREKKPGKCYLGVPHRLDRPASGAMVFAKHARAARRLAEQFEARMVRKTYFALVEGTMEPATGTWVDYLRKIPDQALAEVVESSHPDAREAVLHYRVACREVGATLLEIRLETGRMHQIRVQAASRGFPILGDAQYGATTSFGPPEADARLRWIALHARQLAFRHPMTRQPIEIAAPWPEPWQALGVSLPASDTIE
jgi:RluA family pseudouridine synthase